MSGADEFWDYYARTLDAEAAAIAKAQRLKRLKITEASLVDRPACPGAEIVFHKRGGVMRKSDASDQLEEYLRAIEPDLSYGAALAKHAGDEVVAELYEDVKEAAPDLEATVQKASEAGDGIWSTICRLAKRLQAERPGTLSEGEAIEQICFVERPDLYEQYRLATME